MSINSLTNDVKTDILFKKFLNKTSTSSKIDYFEETETPESRTTIFPHFQLYAQADEIPDSPPSDIINLENGNDDNDDLFLGSYIGKTSSNTPIIKKYFKVNLVNISTSCGKAFQAPNCINVSSINGTFQINEVFKGNNSGARGIITQITVNEIYFKNIGGYHINFNLNETITGISSNSTATVSNAPINCLTHRVLRDTIPPDFGNGEYNCKLYKQNGSRIHFGDGDWILDPHSGVITFYGNLPNNVSSTLPPKITFYRYIGKKGLNTTHTPTGNVGIGTKTPLVSLDINKNDSIRIPVGTSEQRPSIGKSGYLRYNSTHNIYEGYRIIDNLGNGRWEDLTKGIGSDSNTVNIGTGGTDRIINIGNSSGNSGVNIIGGNNNIDINSGNLINIDSNNGINIGTQAQTNNIVIGSAHNNVNVTIRATGNNSSINLEGPLAMGGKPFYFGESNIDGSWRLQQGIFENQSVLLIQKRINGIFKTKQVFQ